MARKVTLITITDEGRDKGNVYQLTEMPASQAERWAARAFLALAKSGVDVPEDIAQSGIAGWATLGLRAMAGVAYADAIMLMDEMFTCVRFVPDPGLTDQQGNVIVRGLVESDTQEVATRLQLRKELLTLHTGFFIPVAPLNLTSEATTGSLHDA